MLRTGVLRAVSVIRAVTAKASRHGSAITCCRKRCDPEAEHAVAQDKAGDLAVIDGGRADEPVIAEPAGDVQREEAGLRVRDQGPQLGGRETAARLVCASADAELRTRVLCENNDRSPG